MKRLFGRSASPSAAVVAMVVFLATALCDRAGRTQRGRLADIAGRRTDPDAHGPPQSERCGEWSIGQTKRDPRADHLDRGESEGGLARAGPHRARRRCERRAAPRGGRGGDGTSPDPLGDTESTAHPWVDIKELKGGGERIIIDLASTSRRSWLPRRDGSPTAWSSMTIATASRTGGSGSTTSQHAPGEATTGRG